MSKLPIVGLLEALACDCELTDGWEDAAGTCEQAATTITELVSALEQCREHVRRAHQLLEESEFADNEVIGGIFARAVNHVDFVARTALSNTRGDTK